MRRVRNFMVIGLLLMASACADTGQVKSLPDNPENRTAAAERYLKAMPPKDMLQGLATRVAPNLPEKDRTAFVEVMNSADLEKAASRITMEGLVKNFTVGELNAMTAFYGSPEGQSAAKKFGPYMAGIMPQIQQEVKKAMDEKQKLEPKGQPEAGPRANRLPAGSPPRQRHASPNCQAGCTRHRLPRRLLYQPHQRYRKNRQARNKPSGTREPWPERQARVNLFPRPPADARGPCLAPAPGARPKASDALNSSPDVNHLISRQGLFLTLTENLSPLP